MREETLEMRDPRISEKRAERRHEKEERIGTQRVYLKCSAAALGGIPTTRWIRGSRRHRQ